MNKPYSKHDLMKLAVKEHMRCLEYPRVGVVIARDGKVIATGYRGEVPKIHAERVALDKLAIADRVGSTLFTTLEPCVALRDKQAKESCTDLIISAGVREVVIGVLDPNGTIYAKGYRQLLDNRVSVSFFSRKLREAIEEETFEYGDVHRVIGAGKRRIPVVGSGIDITVQFSEADIRAVPIRWSSLQPVHGCVDLLSSNGAVTIAAGARNFVDITDPGVFRFPSHFARMEPGMIAIVRPKGATFCVLIKLISIFDNDITTQWEVRDCA